MPYEAHLRADRYDLVVISPHFDDAVYSLGATLARARTQGRSVLVVTVFGHGLERAPRGDGPYDDYATREAEDREAMAELDVDYLWLNLPEFLFRRESPAMRLRALVPHASLADSPAIDVVARALRNLVGPRTSKGATVFLPLGVGAHPDHRLVHEAGRAAFAGGRVAFYEDVPYALDRALVAARLAALRGEPGPAVFAWARATCRLAFRGVFRALAVLPLALAYLLFEFARLATRRSPGLSLESRDEPAVDCFVARKIDAMERYRSQTPIFFPHPVRDALAAPFGAPRERVWRIA